MSSTIKIKRRLTGTVGAPNNGVEGEIAVNFAGGSTLTPELWAHGGAQGWRQLNPPVSISTQSINLGATGSDIGAAYTTWAGTTTNKITGNVVIATFGSPAQAYVLTNPALPGTASSWTSLGGAVSYAAASDVQTGTVTTMALNPANLAGASVNGAAAPVAGDAGKYVRVGANGKINAALLPSDGVSLKGGIAATAAAPTTPAKGDSYFITTAGAFPATWAGIAAQTAKVGDRVIWDGAAWHLIPNGTDLNAYLALAGGNMADTAVVTFAAPAAAAATPVVRINGSDPTKSAIDGFTIDLGTF